MYNLKILHGIPIQRTLMRSPAHHDHILHAKFKIVVIVLCNDCDFLGRFFHTIM